MTRRARLIRFLLGLPFHLGRRRAFALLDRWVADAYQQVIVSCCFAEEREIRGSTDAEGNLVLDDGRIVAREEILALALGAAVAEEQNG